MPNLLGGSEEELQQLIERLEKTAAGYGTEISSDQNKTLINTMKPRSSTNIWMNWKTLEEMDQFKHVGSTQTKDRTSINEVKIRLVQAHSAMNRLAILSKNNAFSFPTKLNSTSHLSSQYRSVDRYPHRMSRAFSVNHQALQAIMVRPRLSS